MADPINPARPHDEAEELLPWYATGRLEAAQRERVESHLAECADCREQLTVERRLIEQFRSFSPEVESGWNRIAARISNENRQVAHPTRTIRQFVDELWAAFAQPAVAALATAQIAFLVAASGIFLWLSQPAYHALGSSPAPTSANLIVMFRADATDQQLQGALGKAGASIVGGPTSTGAYLVHVAPRQRQLALASLETDPHVQLAQPIDSAAAAQ